MRAITNEAGVNLASVNYHFGSKHGLIRAIFSRRLVSMNEERLQRLDAVEKKHGARVPLNELIHAFIGPPLELSADAPGGPRFIRLLGRSYTEPSRSLQETVRAMHAEVIERFKPAFAAALPGLDHEELHWRLHLLVGTLAYCMTGADSMHLVATSHQPDESDQPDPDQIVRRLTAFLAAGMQAPPADHSPQMPVHVASGHAHPSS